MVVITVAIPTYGREEELIHTLSTLLALDPPPVELLVLDQTPSHQQAVADQLQLWEEQECLRWIRLSKPSIPAAMNRALRESRGSRVLFLDDDIEPDPDLISAHLRAASSWPDALVAGRVLQPWHHGMPDEESESSFGFNSLNPRTCHEFMGGNFSVPKSSAIQLGGFDENFVRVAYRFEAEFAHRWCSHGCVIRYVPDALIHHLKAPRGGTRTFGRHLTTLRPDHAVGRYYFIFRTQGLAKATTQSIREFFRSVRTRHHLRRPWWIPLTFVAEVRGLLWAARLSLQGPRFIPRSLRKLLVVTTHPIQYQAPLFRWLTAQSEIDVEVLFLMLPDPRQQGIGFGRSFQWDVPLVDGYRWRLARGVMGSRDLSSYLGVWLLNPLAEIAVGPNHSSPDAVLICGWQCLGMLQLLLSASFKRVPILLRTEANDLRSRTWLVKRFHRFLVSLAQEYLAIGKANRSFYLSCGARTAHILSSPYFVDNQFFSSRSRELAVHRDAQRKGWGLPHNAFTFLFVGKLQPKKRPLDFLQALHELAGRISHAPVCGLVVGSGELMDCCKDYVEKHHLPVSFTGFLNQTELPMAYTVSDAIVLPSDAGETWGLVVNEAMACGLPAVVSDQVGCAQDLVIHGRTGFTYPCGDVHALALAMEQLSSDPHRAALMGAAAKTLIGNSYSVESSGKGVIKAFADCAPRTQRS